jgi:fructokinase
MFAVIGEALLDMVQTEPDGPFEARPGGGPLNIAVGLRRLGHHTYLMARLPVGPLGAVIRRHVEQSQLDLTSAVSAAEPATLAFATLDGRGRASYDFYAVGTADWQWTDTELARLPEDATFVHTGSLAAALDPGARVLLRRWRSWHASGDRLLSFDPNIRPSLGADRQATRQRVEAFVSASHVVKASDEDIGWLYPGMTVDEVLHLWSGLGPELVVVTLGADGTRWVQAGREPRDTAGRAVDVVDTIGAGDAFASGLLSGLAGAGCRLPGDVAALDAVAMDSVLSRATLVAAITCQRAGADPPSRSELGRVCG